MRMEYRIIRRMMEEKDLYEGVSEIMIEKEGEKEWKKEKMEEVKNEKVNEYLENMGEREMKLWWGEDDEYERDVKEN